MEGGPDDWEKEVADVKPKAQKQSEKIDAAKPEKTSLKSNFSQDSSSPSNIHSSHSDSSFDANENKTHYQVGEGKLERSLNVKRSYDYGSGNHIENQGNTTFLKADDTSKIDGKIARKLKQGKLEISSTIDLHGMNQEQAYSALVSLVQQCQANGNRLILVITGKGSVSEGGVLKNALPKWLNSEDLRHKILFYTAANPKHGGSGAFYLYLRK